MERHVPCWNVFRVEGKEPGTQERRAVSICASGTDRLPAWWQPAANLLQGPVLLAVVLLAAVIRELFVHPPSTIILGVCAGLAAAGYTAGTLGALLISLTVGLFGFKESISAAYVTQTLAIETITLLALLTWTVLAAATPRPPARRQRRGALSSQPR